MSLLVVERLCKAFGGVVAVDHVSLSLQAGERLALIGPNGAGKSTLFAMIGGQRRPDSGRVQFDGRNITGVSAHRLWRLGIGRTFQIAAVFGSMSVLENVQMARLVAEGRLFDPFGSTKRIGHDDAARLLATVGLESWAATPAGRLAYGDIKRLELAIAFANTPKLLLMDEPTAGMAPDSRHALMDLVSTRAEATGTAILFTEHDMDVVFGHADRVLVLAGGQLIAEGTPDAIRGDAEVQALYLGKGARA